jgi:heme-degrading monooxygenase HmoA
LVDQHGWCDVTAQEMPAAPVRCCIHQWSTAVAFIAKTPKPPYYAVIFTSINADGDHAEHAEVSRRMVELAATYDGFLGIEPARSADGSGVSAIYWKDTDSIAAFGRDPEHLIAKKKGREIWYSHYMIRICKVEREYGRSD